MHNPQMFAWVLLQSVQCGTEGVETRQAAPLDVFPDAANSWQPVYGFIHCKFGGCALRKHPTQVHDADLYSITWWRCSYNTLKQTESKHV